MHVCNIVKNCRCCCRQKTARRLGSIAGNPCRLAARWWIAGVPQAARVHQFFLYRCLVPQLLKSELVLALPLRPASRKRWNNATIIDRLNYRRFWYQVFTCVSDRLSASATSLRSATDRYFWHRNFRSRYASCAWVNAVRRRRGLRPFAASAACSGPPTSTNDGYRRSLSQSWFSAFSASSDPVIMNANTTFVGIVQIIIFDEKLIGNVTEQFISKQDSSWINYYFRVYLTND